MNPIQKVKEWWHGKSTPYEYTNNSPIIGVHNERHWLPRLISKIFYPIFSDIKWTAMFIVTVLCAVFAFPTFYQFIKTKPTTEPEFSNKDTKDHQAIENRPPQPENQLNQQTAKNQDMPSIPEIVTRNEEERYVLPGTTTNFFQSEVRVTVVENFAPQGGTFRAKAKLAGDEGIKNIKGEVGDVFEFGRFKEYKVSISELNGNYAVFNIKRRELTNEEIAKKAYPDMK